MNKSSRNNVGAKPFLKWVGGKRQVIATLREQCPPTFKRYHEPFVGGGALFFSLEPSRAILSDTNKELIGCYQVVRDKVGALVRALRGHVYKEKYYYDLRSVDPATMSPVDRAARMIYLNKAGYNGLYRVNSKGLFNVPFGKHKNPNICDEVTLRACAKTLARTDLCPCSFEEVVTRARAGDFVYLDPPYIPLTETANFTAYQKHGFSMNNQEKLADVFEKLASRNVLVMLSNSDVKWIHERYAAHQIRVIQACRSINSNAAKRGPVGEVVITNY